MAEKKSKRVKTLSSFMKWLEQFNDGQYLFRGVSKDTYEMEASTYRRLPKEDSKTPNKLLKINKELIDQARLLGHDLKDGHRFSDLELLAELQHFGAATCLIDFSRNAQIALWFACQQSSSGAANGKVVAVRADDPIRFKTVIPKLVTEKDIDYFFEGDENGRYPLYQWQPKQQNNRVIAQQSVFIFGGSPIEVAAECIILENSKPEILSALDRSASITEASIYPDFDGFARLHAQNKPYIEPDVQGYLQSGISAQMENKLDDAITYYNEVISLDPDSPILAETLAVRGYLYANKREYDLALADWTKAIDLDPEDAGVYRNRGTAYLFKGDFDSAIQDLNKAIDLDPEEAGVYNNRGLAYTGKSDFDLAIQDHSKAIDLAPEDANAYNNRGLACAGKSDFDSAIQDFNKAIDLDPEYAGAYNNRGHAYTGKSDFDLAIQDYSKAIDLASEDAGAYSNRGTAYYRKGDFDSAIQDLNKAIDLDPEDANAYNNRGHAYAGKSDFDSAIQDYSKAIDLAPEDAGAYSNRGTAYYRKGDFDSAIQDYSKAIDLAPEDAGVYNNRGHAYTGKSDFDSAIQDFNKVIDLDPEDANAYKNRGLAYTGKSDFDLAIQDYSKAIDLASEDAGAYSNRGHAYHNIGDFAAAIEDYSKSIELDPHSGTHCNRGEAWLHLKEWEKAKADLMTAKDMDYDIIKSFQNDYESVEDFEKKNKVKVPEDIAALLSRA